MLSFRRRDPSPMREAGLKDGKEARRDRKELLQRGGVADILEGIPIQSSLLDEPKKKDLVPSIDSFPQSDQGNFGAGVNKRQGAFFGSGAESGFQGPVEDRIARLRLANGEKPAKDIGGAGLGGGGKRSGILGRIEEMGVRAAIDRGEGRHGVSTEAGIQKREA